MQPGLAGAHTEDAPPGPGQTGVFDQHSRERARGLPGRDEGGVLLRAVRRPARGSAAARRRQRLVRRRRIRLPAAERPLPRRASRRQRPSRPARRTGAPLLPRRSTAEVPAYHAVATGVVASSLTKRAPTPPPGSRSPSQQFVTILAVNRQYPGRAPAAVSPGYFDAYRSSPGQAATTRSHVRVVAVGPAEPPLPLLDFVRLPRSQVLAQACAHPAPARFPTPPLHRSGCQSDPDTHLGQPDLDQQPRDRLARHPAD
jgi:hypothetical protein